GFNSPPAAPTAPVPPIGVPASVSVPPIAAPSPTSAPAVGSWDVQMYQCKPNDTLQSICKDKYLDVRYERALLAYNRNYMPGNTGIHNEPPVLQGGQQIMLPPMRILEQKYGAQIPNLTPVTAPTAPAAGAPLTQTSQSSPGTARLYTVQGPNEM